MTKRQLIYLRTEVRKTRERFKHNPWSGLCSLSYYNLLRTIVANVTYIVNKKLKYVNPDGWPCNWYMIHYNNMYRYRGGKMWVANRFELLDLIEECINEKLNTLNNNEKNHPAATVTGNYRSKRAKLR